MSEYNIRYLVKKGEGGKPREVVLQECVDEEWRDVPTIFIEDAGEAEIERSGN